MSNPNWAKDLSKETIEKFITIGDGHTLFKPEAYIDIGIPEEIVAKYTTTHKSHKYPTYEAQEALAQAIQTVLNEYVVDEEWDPRELVNSLRSEDDCNGMAEQFSTDLLALLIEKEIETISGYHPKETIFDNQGNVIESMDAVYGLEITRGMVTSLGLDYESKMGRGFQYMSYCKAIKEYLDNK